MKDRTDKWKLFAAAAMCILIAAVSVTGGLLLEKRRHNVPAVEIIEVGTTASSFFPVQTEESQTGERTETQKIASEISSAGTLVNINTATASELEGLKGIGEKTAQAIIEYREKVPFKSIEDIKNVKGIGDKKFEDIKDSICV